MQRTPFHCQAVSIFSQVTRLLWDRFSYFLSFLCLQGLSSSIICHLYLYESQPLSSSSRYILYLEVQDKSAHSVHIMHSKNCVHIMYVPTYIRTDISQSSSAFLSWNAVCAIPRPKRKGKDTKSTKGHSREQQ
ncbi:hypothetical protein F5051DRAFT_161696 [Lentinula edodes]|nr:hypothetical protein F5051DRAFT_161696 [Lentinula edodes]